MGFLSKTLLRTGIGLFLFISPLFVTAQKGHVTLDGNRYYFSEEKNTWENARKYCTGIGLDLVSIDDEAEQNRISGHLSKLHRFLFVKTNWDYWLGAKSDPNVGLGFTWTTGAPLLYTKWLKQEPSRTGSTGGCVITTNHASSSKCVSTPCVGSWSSVACDQKFRYICEPVQNHASAGSSSFSQGSVDPDLSERIQPVSGSKGGGRLTQQTTVGQVSFTQKPDFQGTDQSRFSNQRPDANQKHLTQQVSGGNQRPDANQNHLTQQVSGGNQRPDVDEFGFGGTQEPDSGSNQGIEQGFGQLNTRSTQKPDFQGTDQSRFSNQRPDSGSNQGFGQLNTRSTQKPDFQGTDQSSFSNQRPDSGSNQGFGQLNTRSTQKPDFQGTDQSSFSNQRPDSGSSSNQGFGQLNTRSTQKPDFQGTDQSRFSNQKPDAGSNQGIEQGFGQFNTRVTSTIKPGSNNFGRVTQGPSSQINIQGSSGIVSDRPDVEDLTNDSQQYSGWANAKGSRPHQTPLNNRPPK